MRPKEARKIRPESDKEVQILTAEARKQAEITRGQGSDPKSADRPAQLHRGRAEHTIV